MAQPSKFGGKALRDALIAAFIVLSVAAITGYVVYRSAEAGLKAEVQGTLQNIAASAAGFLDGDLHEQITKPEDKGGELYEKTRAPFFTLLKTNPNIAFIYTVVEREGKVFFILDSKIIKPGEEDDTSGVMEEYKDGTDTMKQALAEKRQMVEEESYTDEWGTFLSAYAPIYNSKHEYLGIVGVDIRMTDLMERLAAIHRALAVGMIIALVASVVVGFGVWAARSAALRSEAENLAQQAKMAAMEKARIAEQLQAQEAADRHKREAMHTLADRFEDSVKHVVGAVAQSAVKMQTGAESVTQIAADTKQRSNAVSDAAGNAAQTSSHVAAAAEELSASVREISAQTQKSSQVAQEATNTAQDAQGIIQSLAEKSDKVGEIVEVIKLIAGQINMLALNATIESARAGEAGKGFAVVASEVKNLANEVGRATQEITEQIGDMQAATTSSVDAMMKIIGIINQVSDSTTAVAAAVEEQAAVTNEIAHNIALTSTGAQAISQEIGGVQEGAEKTGTTAATVLESAKSLGEQSTLLKTKVDEFLASVREG